MDEPLPFGEQLVAFLPNMRRFALSLCRSREMADDLVQAACERALAARDSYESGTRFDAWILRILRNLWIDRGRRQKTAGPQEDIDLRNDIAGSDGEPAMHARLTLKEVSDAIDVLPEDQRDVLILICVEELSYRQASQVLDVPIGTVMSRLARARKSLARTMGIKTDDTRSADVKGRIS